MVDQINAIFSHIMGHRLYGGGCGGWYKFNTFEMLDASCLLSFFFCLNIYVQ